MKNFNPRSHEGNDGVDLEGDVAGGISIHVPTKGTTENVTTAITAVSISIHVPTKGTTSYRSGIRGEHIISIHVPTKGTTLLHLDQTIVLAFQSTFPRRERQRLNEPMSLRYSFQSTFPRRERQDAAKFADDYQEISIHVPTKGTTAFFHNFSENSTAKYNHFT